MEEVNQIRREDAIDCKACGNLARPKGGYCYVHKKKPIETPCNKFIPFFKLPCGGVDKDGNKVY